MKVRIEFRDGSIELHEDVYKMGRDEEGTGLLRLDFGEPTEGIECHGIIYYSLDIVRKIIVTGGW